MMLLFTVIIPRGVFCERRSQKTRDIPREIMLLHDFCASRSVSGERSEQDTLVDRNLGYAYNNMPEGRGSKLRYARPDMRADNVFCE